MNVLFLNGSPRKKGFTASVMKLIKENINSGHDVTWIDVYDLKVSPCISCLKCRPNGDCVLPKDDGHFASEKIRVADILVMGSPTYFGNVSGPLKNLIDRSLTAFEEIAASGLDMPVPLHIGQKAALVTACNIPSPLSGLPTQARGTIAAMQIVLNAGGYDLIGTIILDGAASKSEIPEDIREAARRIAEGLIA